MLASGGKHKGARAIRADKGVPNKPEVSAVIGAAAAEKSVINSGAEGMDYFVDFVVFMKNYPEIERGTYICQVGFFWEI